MSEAAHDAFFAQVRPLCAAIEGMITASEALRHHWGSRPDPDSGGMAEIVEEPKFASDWRAMPVQHITNAAILMLGASEDHASSMCRLLANDPVPVWSHAVLARSAMEASARAQWLLDPTIDVRSRVARGMTDGWADQTALARLYNAMGDPESAEKASDRARVVVEAAERVGFQVVTSRKGDVLGFEEQMPAITDLVRVNLDDEDPDAEPLGRVTYVAYSGIAHARLHGLLPGVEPDMATAFGGRVTGKLHTRADGACAALTGASLGYVHALGALMTLFGWRDDECVAACKHVFEIASRVLPTD